MAARAEKDVLSQPGRRRGWLPKVQLDSDAFGSFAEAAARFMGTGKFIVYMTVFVIAWVTLNVVGIFGWKWDVYPFIFLNLMFSTQASYAAPLILLAQNRQEVRDKLSLDEDRRLAAQSRADMDYLAREIASIRMLLGELATRDFVRSELRGELRDLTERLERVVRTEHPDD